MNDVTNCPRCGFIMGEDGFKMPELPDGIQAPPLPKSALPHPEGVCCSPFEISQKLYWNLDLVDPDMPPVMVLFKELISIQGAEFKLVNGEWVQEGSPRAEFAAVRVVKSSVHPCQEMLLDEVVDRDLEVPVENLTPVERWPVLEVA